MIGAASPRQSLLQILAEALQTVDGRACVRRTLKSRPTRAPTWVCAIGKAAPAMLLGAHDALGPSWPGGLLITKPGHLEPGQLAGLGIEAHLGGHPLPTQDSLAAGLTLLRRVSELPADARLLFLLSGGASSLVEIPTDGLGLAELRRMNTWLLGSGLAIDSINLVRKAVSRIKGGGLLRAVADRPIRVLAISDVPDDDPAVIGSGLLVPEPDLQARLTALELPSWLADWVWRGLAERGAPAPVAPAIELVATLDDAKSAAAAAGRRAGLPVHLHAQPITGDAARAGRHLAESLLRGPPGLHVWGGETTVRLPSEPGRGGRNQHLALAAAIALAGHPGVLLLSSGTDGTDGPTQDAGALIDGSTLSRAADAGLDAAACLARADSGPLLEASGDLIRTGPTGTNVMDLILGLRH
ncbi:MAG: DUF4147 domain-containing protein [Sphingobacteriia bacterium]|nr:DUF4147 domain-containing protein [Sphingobacteriia bacterium]NCC39557.1 DUF4147 domain-containing protein [Gammaproteobacteria bacterium]